MTQYELTFDGVTYEQSMTPADEMPCTWQAIPPETLAGKEERTTWHDDWKNKVPISHTETSFGRRIADIYTPDGTVVELQHSPITGLEIRQRESDYGRMMWLFDVTDAVTAKRLTFVTHGEDENYVTFRWRRPRGNLTHCRQTVLLDTGRRALLWLGDLHIHDSAAIGWGRWIYTRTFERFLNGDSEAAQFVARITGHHRLAA